MIVIDASAAVRTVIDPETPFRAMLNAVELVIAPELIVAEIVSAFRKYVRARMLTRSQADKSIKQALALIDQLQPLRELVPDVLALGARTDSSAYDLFYLALAQRTGATLLTADVALGRLAQALGIGVATEREHAP